MTVERPPQNSTDADTARDAKPSTAHTAQPALTVKEAAARLGVSANLVYLLCARAKIRHERHGLGRGVIRIPPEALDEYRRKCTVREPSAAPVKPAKVTRKFEHLKL